MPASQKGRSENSSSDHSILYSAGDWIVHSFYGVGQIKSIEVKSISGEKKQYFRIRSTDSTFWLPINQENAEVIRPLSTPEEFQQVLKTLQKPAENMSSDFKIRRSRIRTASAQNTPKVIARLLRDLHARQRSKHLLNEVERDALRTLKQQFIEEWAIVTDTKIEELQSRLNELLNTK